MGNYSDEYIDHPISLGHTFGSNHKLSKILCGNGFTIIAETSKIDSEMKELQTHERERIISEINIL